MTSKFVWLIRRIKSQIWFRVSLYALGAVVTALIASFAAHFVPDEIVSRIKEGTARGILSIVASSMLAVATFSLGSMVQAYSAAASSATPRATRILINDAFTQTVISTFLGAFVFSMVGIIALSLDYYDRAGEFVLVLVSAGVIAMVITTLFGWLDHLANLVRLGEIVAKVADTAEETLRARALAPRLGGLPPEEGSDMWQAIHPVETGYVGHIDPYRLQKIAEAADGRIRVVSMPGHLADPTKPLVRLSWNAGETELTSIRSAFSLERERSFDQDPRFCMQVLCEIASRALSPGINDPGTAIGVIAVQQRLLTLWHDLHQEAPEAEQVNCPRVMAPAVSTIDLFEDLFGPLTRDGAETVEVGIRLLKTLATLASFKDDTYGAAARQIASAALGQAEEALVLERDKARLRELVALVESVPPA